MRQHPQKVQKQKSAEPAALFGGSASCAGANGQPLVAGEDLRRSSRCHNQGAFLALVGGNCRHFNHPRGTDSKKPGQARALSRYLPEQISGTALLRSSLSGPSRRTSRPGSRWSRRRSSLRPLLAGATRRCSPCRVLRIQALAPFQRSASCLRRERTHGRTGKCCTVSRYRKCKIFKGFLRFPGVFSWTTHACPTRSRYAFSN